MININFLFSTFHLRLIMYFIKTMFNIKEFQNITMLRMASTNGQGTSRKITKIPVWCIKPHWKFHLFVVVVSFSSIVVVILVACFWKTRCFATPLELARPWIHCAIIYHLQEFQQDHAYHHRIQNFQILMNSVVRAFRGQILILTLRIQFQVLEGKTKDIYIVTKQISISVERKYQIDVNY